MNEYSKWNDESLREELINKKIDFQEEWTRDQIIQLLQSVDEHVEQSNQNVKQNDLDRAGVIINILIGSASIPIWIFLSVFLIGIPFLIGDICAIVSNIRFKNGKDNRAMAGALAIIFNGIIGGVLILINDNKKETK
ncbi:MAG: hypothetical protein TYPL_2320 [Candidatus Tyloplasma litorale]|nr:MAG: hypothetical protein TYPL_2320 [Mycoplasmatales bacterium]